MKKMLNFPFLSSVFDHKNEFYAHNGVTQRQFIAKRELESIKMQKGDLSNKTRRVMTQSISNFSLAQASSSFFAVSFQRNCEKRDKRKEKRDR